MSLPKDFCIKRNITHPLWDKFIHSLNEMDDLDNLVGHCSMYYGVDDCMPTCSPYAFGEVISLEYWNENADHTFEIGDYVIVRDKYRADYPEATAAKVVEVTENRYYMQDDTFISEERKNIFRFATVQEIGAITSFVLPERWAIKVTNSIITDWLNDHATNGCKNYIYKECASEYLHYPDYLGYHIHGGVQNGYTQITLDQFKKYVLRERCKQNTMEKKIIGYKWKNGFGNKYEKAAIEICNSNKAPVTNLSRNCNNKGCLFLESSVVADAIEKAGVLDLWFEPVYKEPIELKVSKTDGGEINIKIDGEMILADSDNLFTRYFEVDAASELQKNILTFNSAGIKLISDYDVKIDTISVGCQKGIKVSDLQKVFSKLQNK